MRIFTTREEAIRLLRILALLVLLVIVVMLAEPQLRLIARSEHEIGKLRKYDPSQLVNFIPWPKRCGTAGHFNTPYCTFKSVPEVAEEIWWGAIYNLLYAIEGKPQPPVFPEQKN